MNCWHAHSRRWTWLFATAGLLALAGCDQADQSTHGGAADVPDATSTAALGGADDPTCVFVSPAANASYDYTAPGVPITATIQVANVVLAPGGQYVQFYLNGVEEGGAVYSAGSFTYNSVPIGRHQLACRILNDDASTLPNPESLDKVYIKVLADCDSTADCVDEQVCSNHSCNGGTCNYGPASGNCCDSELECPYGYSCENNSCVECLDDGACDDGNDCTVDFCGVDGACVHETIDGCCEVDNDCNDGDQCTTDSCSLGACSNLPNGDPFCCNVTSDCEPADPCTAFFCYHSLKNPYPVCRFGPSKVNCCTDPSQCSDSNPCTLNQCEYANPTDPSGSCVYESDPASPECCVAHTDCDDDDPSTQDSCEFLGTAEKDPNTCYHTPNPNYCELPDVPTRLVINEIFLATGGLVDAQAEWFEIYMTKPGDGETQAGEFINLTGYSVQTSLGGSHTFTSANAAGGTGGMMIFPGAYWVAAASANQTLNGGFAPNYQYGLDISFPDSYEDGQDHVVTIQLLDPQGALVDEVTYDTATDFIQDGHSQILRHPHSDNSVFPGAWIPSGSNIDPAKNKKYGAAANKLYGTPKNHNDGLLGLPAADQCTPPDGASACVEPRCGLGNGCEFPFATGCCESDAHCEDFDACTNDECNLETGECKSGDEIINPNCCVDNSQCNDTNPCNIDKCIGSECRYSPNVFPNCCVTQDDCDGGDQCLVYECNTLTNQCLPPVDVVLDGGLQCCNSNGDCEDNNPATQNLCDFTQGPPVCVFPVDEEYCDSADDLCDDNNPCTNDACDVENDTCNHNPIAGCCQVNSQCPSDGDACTVAICLTDTGSCVNEPLPNCCNVKAECEDNNACTTDLCGTNNTCHNNAIAGCCNSAADCGDNNNCTVDSCVNSACVYTPQSDCCTPGASQAQLINECGPISGSPSCVGWECLEGGLCNYIESTSCCQDNEDCEDSDPCTTDFCTTAETCKHIPIAGGNCCVFNSDCPEVDDNICTTPVCDAGLCGEAALPGCSPPIEPPIDDGPEPPTDPTVCWKGTTGGFLGPDNHSQCIGSQGAIGLVAVLESPDFNPGGADEVAIQFNAAWDNGPGNHSIVILVRKVGEAWTSAATIGTLDATGQNSGSQFNFPVPNTHTPFPQVQIGWYVDSDAQFEVNVEIDDFKVAVGNAPFFVKELQTDKTYERPADELTDGGTFSAALGNQKTKTWWAHDPDAGETLEFEVVDAPSFLTIDEVATVPLFGVVQVKLALNPTVSAHIGSYDVTLRVSDGKFVDEIPVKVTVSLGAGYVLWSPQGVAPVHADAIASALTTLGKPFQRVTDLSAVADWTQVTGLFVTNGGLDGSAAMTSSKTQAARDYIEDGGDVYFEWADFGEQADAFSNLFQAGILQFEADATGNVLGLSTLHPMSWQYDVDGGGPGLLAETFGQAAHSIAPLPNSGGRYFMTDEPASKFFAVGSEHETTGARLYVTTLVYSRFTSLGNNPSAMIDGVIEFWETGLGQCTAHGACEDGNPCTTDLCVGNLCQNNFDPECELCHFDGECAVGEACRINGECSPIPGSIHGAAPFDDAFSCDTTDEIHAIVKQTSGFDRITNVNLKVHVEAPDGLTVGPLKITLSHGGTSVEVRSPDLSSDTIVDTTYDFATPPGAGSLNDFDGQVLEGPWVITLHDVEGSEACWTVHAVDLWLETTPAPGCVTGADCDNGQFCDGAEQCIGGDCQVGVAPTCDDSNVCSTNVCDPGADSGGGLCDNSGRVQSCAGAPCSGSNAIDAGDGGCGIDDYCDGGLDGATGTCALFWPDATHALSGDVLTLIEDNHCVTEVVEVASGDLFVDDVNIQILLEHDAFEDMTVQVFGANNEEVTLLNHQYDGVGGALESTFTLNTGDATVTSNLCAFRGSAPDGTWKVRVCDDFAGDEGILKSFNLGVETTNTDPHTGNSCDNAIPFAPLLDETITLSGDNRCFANNTTGGCGGFDGHDRVWVVTVPGPNPVRLTSALTTYPNFEDQDWDGVLYVTDSCDAGSTLCANSNGPGATEHIDQHLAPGTWYFVVDSTSEFGYGDFEVDVLLRNPLPDGSACDEALDCLAGHCQNGFCCAGGDCCSIADEDVTYGSEAQALATSCPSSYLAGPTCDNATSCQGHRVDAMCNNSICESINVADDTACDGNTESSDCALYDSVFCNAQQVQVQPPCVTTCDFAGQGDSQCDEGVHCFEDTADCRIDLIEGLGCGRIGHCQSEFCVDGLCCDGGCDGLCDQCDKPGFLGQCSFRQAATDPEDECPGTGLCGGVCDGAGQCSYTPDTVNCSECTRCDGTGFCDNAVAQNTDPDDNCDDCLVCNGSGACDFVPSGADPLGECGLQAAGTCGQDGTCAGDGSCKLWDAGTVCVTQTCSSGYEDPNHLCDGIGNCEDPADYFCYGFICADDEINCRADCLNDGHCISGYFCEDEASDPNYQVCLPKIATGLDCDSDHECQTNFCTDTVCCEQACAGPCRQCDLDVAPAADIYVAIQNMAFSPNPILVTVTDSVTWTNFDTVAHTVTSDTGAFDSGTIAPGASYTYVFNTDGDYAYHCSFHPGMTGTVVVGSQANQPDGQCRNHPDGTDPEAGCGNYFCGGDGGCANSCATDSDCKPGLWCNGSTCEAKKPLGNGCSGGNQCQSGICNEDNVCCDAVCGSLCESCKLAGLEGTCTLIANGQDTEEECNGVGQCGGVCNGANGCFYPPATENCGTCQRCNAAGSCAAVPATTDPDDDCSTCQTCSGSGTCMNVVLGQDYQSDCDPEAQSTCGLTGQCDGNAKCDFYGQGTIAAAQSCSGGVTSLADTCNGSGGVNDGGTQDCTPYICQGTSCGTTCSNHSDCHSSFYCDFADANGNGLTNECLPLKANGESCTNDSANFECTGSFCNNGFCCSNDVDCCQSNNNCQHLAVAAVCDSAVAGGCDGHRIDAYCDGNKECKQTPDIDDDSACTGLVCLGAACNSGTLQHTASRVCSADGLCNIGGQITSCNDGNTCTDDSCSPSGGCSNLPNDDAAYCYTGPALTDGVGACHGGSQGCSGGTLGACTGQVLPATEVCNGVDDDCDGQTDEVNSAGCSNFYYDFDDDLYGTDSFQCHCAGSAAQGHYTASANGDCDDNNAARSPGKKENCATNFDDDCDNAVNESSNADKATGCTQWYKNADGDPYGSNSSECYCGATGLYNKQPPFTGDCNDNNANVHPGKSEACNNVDDNCDGSTDEGSAGCSNPPNGTAGCNSGTCTVAGCTTHYYDLNNTYSDGCEAKKDADDISNIGNQCTGARVVNDNLVDNNTSNDMTGTLVPGGDVDWFRVRVKDEGTKGHNFSFDVRFDVNPGGKKFDIYLDGCSSLICSGSTHYQHRSSFNYKTSGCTAFEGANTAKCGNQNCDPNTNNHCNENKLHNRYLYIKVYGTADKNNYTIRFSNGKYL